MSLKSLGLATAGLLRRGLKKTLHILSNGYIRIEDDGEPEVFIVPGGGFWSRGRKPVDLTPPPVDNNLALILLLNRVL